MVYTGLWLTNYRSWWYCVFHSSGIWCHVT